MKLGYVIADGPGETDRLLSRTAAWLAQDGRRLAGVVKILAEAPAGADHCDMDLRVLPDGPGIRITQSLGEGAQGCRLDPAGIEEAVSCVEASDIARADMLFLNKFGPQEAEGRGFCGAIGTALESGVPVILGVGRGSREAFDAFADGLAERVPADEGSIRDWCRGALAAPARG